MLWAKRSISSRATTWPSLAYPLLTAAYVISGKLGLLLAVPPGYATAIFAPAGIAVAAQLSGLRLDAKQAPTDTKEVRQAIAHAIDMPTIIDTILGGYAAPVKK